MSMRRTGRWIALLACLFLFISLFPNTGLLVSQAGAQGSEVIPWARMDTFDSIPAGSTGQLGDIELISGPYTDVVVVDGSIWAMYRGNESRAIIRYLPYCPVEDWNVSYEAFAPREGSSYTGVGQEPGRYALIATLQNAQGEEMVSIKLQVGNASSSGEGIYYRDLRSDIWAKLDDDILPAYPQVGPVQVGQPDHYTVSFAKKGQSITTQIWHSQLGLVSVREVEIGEAVVRPGLIFSNDAIITPLQTAAGNYGVNGGWMLDDLAIRPIESRYGQIDPVLEYVEQDDPLWLELKDVNGIVITDAEVEIDNVPALFDAPTSGYLAIVGQETGWSLPVPYEVVIDGMKVTGALKVTKVVDDPLAKVSQWWNGWDWVSVFGLDDCNGPESALLFYKDFHHPTTAFVNSFSGNSSEILESRSEIAMHLPHDYFTWMKKSWPESVASAQEGQTSFISYYDYASYWDDPENLGLGDSYISLAYPGNSATYQTMLAQYLQGVRIAGRGGTLVNGVPGNSTIIGSYWTEEELGISGHTGIYDPMTPFDLMDINRQWCTDYSLHYEELMAMVSEVAERGGVLNVYGHPSSPLLPSTNYDAIRMLHWIDDLKDSGPENWKATEGEVASYTYGRWTTSVQKDAESSSGNTLVFDVSRTNPHLEGYWLVPITIEIDLQGKNVGEIVVIEGEQVLRSSLSGVGGLRDLQGQRMMDTGYDIRDGKLYISHYWNSSAQIILYLDNPHIMNQPRPVGVIGMEYRYSASSSPADLGPLQWDFDNSSAPWLEMVSSNGSVCELRGIPTSVGEYPVSLQVSDDDTRSWLNWTIRVGEVMDIWAPHTQLISAPANGTWTSGAVSLEFSATDKWSGVETIAYQLDDGYWRNYVGNLTVVKQGWHVLRYHALDWFGNAEEVQVLEFGVDDRPPNLHVFLENGTVLYQAEAEVRLLAFDGLSGIKALELQVDGGPTESVENTEQLSLRSLEVGEHTVTISALDQAGNRRVLELHIVISSFPPTPGGDFAQIALATIAVMLALLLVVTWTKRRGS